MNLYVRFFDYEALVPDEASVLDFLSTIPQIRMECVSEKKLHKFIEGDSRYPLKERLMTAIIIWLSRLRLLHWKPFKRISR